MFEDLENAKPENNSRVFRVLEPEKLSRSNQIYLVVVYMFLRAILYASHKVRVWSGLILLINFTQQKISHCVDAIYRKGVIVLRFMFKGTHSSIFCCKECTLLLFAAFVLYELKMFFELRYDAIEKLWCSLCTLHWYSQFAFPIGINRFIKLLETVVAILTS